VADTSTRSALNACDARVTELERENATLRAVADAADRIMAQLELADDPIWDGNEDYDRLAKTLAARAADSEPRSDA
jgi:hypothetical protein